MGPSRSQGRVITDGDSPCQHRARWPRLGLGRSLAKGAIYTPPFNHQIDSLPLESLYSRGVGRRGKSRQVGNRVGDARVGIVGLWAAGVDAPAGRRCGAVRASRMLAAGWGGGV